MISTPSPTPFACIGVSHYTLLGIPSWHQDSLNSSSSKGVSPWLQSSYVDLGGVGGLCASACVAGGFCGSRMCSCGAVLHWGVGGCLVGPRVGAQGMSGQTLSKQLNCRHERSVGAFSLACGSGGSCRWPGRPEDQVPGPPSSSHSAPLASGAPAPRPARQEFT